MAAKKSVAKAETAKAEFDGRIWPNILAFNENIDSQLIAKSNFIFGASTIVLLFILNKVATKEFFADDFFINLPWLILLVGSFVSSLLSMLIILPKLRIFSKKERISGDIFYYKNITQFYTRETYQEYLSKLPWDNKRIADAYAHQVYSLAQNIIPYKFKMLKVAGWTLVTTVLLSVVAFFVSYVSLS